MNTQGMPVDARIEIFRKFMNDNGNLIAQHLIDRLEPMGFFTAPASSKYHGAYEGGLFDHSYTVAEELVSMTKALELDWARDTSPAIVGMLHDICKCDNYIDVGAGKFVYNLNVKSLGHGDRSVTPCQKILPLTAEEMQCIRYHMGAYMKEDWEGFDTAIRAYPNVLFTHTADMYASKVRGI